MKSPSRIITAGANRLAGTFAVIVSLLTITHAQAPATAKASISGSVLKMSTNDPVAGIAVGLANQDCQNLSIIARLRSVTTADDGKFQFPDLDTGSYCLIASDLTGTYVPPHYLSGGWSGRGVTIAVKDSQRIENVRLNMEPTGSISGRVVDNDGDPVVNARVNAFERNYRNSEARLIILDSVVTDDRGQYRLPWLPSGQYWVSAIETDLRRSSVSVVRGIPARIEGIETMSPPIVITQHAENGTTTEETRIPVWYGGTTDRSAARAIEVSPGKDSASIDISLAMSKTRALHVRGVVINGETGQPMPGAQVRLTPREWIADPIVPTANSNNVGSFDLSGVTSGSFFVYAIAPGADGKLILSGYQPVDLSSDNIDGVRIRVVPSFDIPGKVGIEAGAGVDNASVAIGPIRGSNSGGAPGGPATAVVPGNPSSVRVNPVIKVFRVPDLAGTPTAAIGIVPFSSETGGLSSSSPIFNVGPDGTFVIRGIGPGSYRIGVEPSNVSDPQNTAYAFRPSLSNAYLKTFRYGSQDLLKGLLVVSGKTDEVLQLVMGTDVAEINGRVTNNELGAVRNATVVIVPSFDRDRKDLYRIARSDNEGRFRLQGVAPGDYKLFAWEEVEAGIWFDSLFIESIERDARVKSIHMESNERLIMDIPAIPAK